MNPIYIPQLLSATDRTRTVSFETVFEGLETLTPVRAELSVRHGTTFLEVSGRAKTIVTLTCDRCLQRYNHRLAIDTQEIIWLSKELAVDQDMPLEQEVNPESLVESLSSEGYFEPETWIYEQVCLALPQRQICDLNCPGILPVEHQRSGADRMENVDHRWSALAALKQQLAPEDSQQN